MDDVYFEELDQEDLERIEEENDAPVGPGEAEEEVVTSVRDVKPKKIITKPRLKLDDKRMVEMIENEHLYIKTEHMFHCNECNRSFKNKGQLSNHIKAHAIKKDPFMCEKCSATFSSKYNCLRHLNRCKGYVSESSKSCPLCKVKGRPQYLIEHFQKSHNITINEEYKEFFSKVEFLLWKDQMEKDTTTRFVISRSPTYFLEMTKMSYACHRAGIYRSESTGKRQLKAGGSHKIGGYCPAKINVSILPSGIYRITFISTHVGHEFEPHRIQLTLNERKAIAEKLSQSIPVECILNEAKESLLESNNIQRIHLLKRKDLLNIKSSFNLTNVPLENSGNKRLMFDDWILNIMTSSNIVRFYKPRGQVLEHYPDLKINDMVIVLFNNYQLEMLSDCNSDIVCIDRFKYSVSNQVNLYSLNILDESKQAFPAAFLVTNRDDVLVLTLFFNCVKSAHERVLLPKVFISNVGDMYFVAWSSVMPVLPSLKRCFFSWHVEYDWKDKLKKMKNQEKQTYIYKSLLKLMFITCKNSFYALKANLIKFFNEDNESREFYIYFRNNYLNLPSTWAHCFKYENDENTESTFEILHNSLKLIFSKGKTELNNKIDSLIKFVRDRVFLKKVKDTNVELSKKLSIMRLRHKASCNLLGRVIEDGWMVYSPHSPDKEYKVILYNNTCDCLVKCKDCNSCVHQYCCTCDDYTVKETMCKHIHYVCQLGVKINYEISEIDYIVEIDGTSELSQIKLLDESYQSETLENKIKHYQNYLMQLTSEIQYPEQLEALIEHTASMRSIMEAAVPQS